MMHKIVVLGDINGRYTEVFGKLNKLQTKQSFAFAIIVGDLFGDQSADSDQSAELEALVDGKIEIALPTYFIPGRSGIPRSVLEQLAKNGGEVCTNLICLGNKSCTKTLEGIRLVAVGGKYDQGNAKHETSRWQDIYSDLEAKEAISYNEADILLSSDWPESIRTGSSVKYIGEKANEVQSIAELCSALKPKYHFSCSASFFEREPFFHDVERPKPVTRFISLAPYGNELKEKWIYAFTLDLAATPSMTVDAGTTASPLHARKRGLASQKEAFNGFRYATDDTLPSEHGHRGKRRKTNRPPEPEQCYFCLSNPACETHMIASLGDEAYVTVAKGPLTLRDSFPDLSMPFHMLIIPLTHIASLRLIADSDARATTNAEMCRYRDALHACVTAKSTDTSTGAPQLGSVVWEVSRSGGVHDHWQFLPVPAELVHEGRIESTFRTEAQTLDYPAFTKSDETEAVDSDAFRVTVLLGKEQSSFSLALDDSFRFDLQFGRRVLAKILALPKRTNWKDCGQSRAEEERDVTTFKGLFQPFDFALA